MNKFRELRLKFNLSQIQMAGRLDTTQITISNVERGKGFPNSVLLERYCQFFNVDKLTLLNGFAPTPETESKLNILRDNIKDLEKIVSHLETLSQGSNWYVLKKYETDLEKYKSILATQRQEFKKLLQHSEGES